MSNRNSKERLIEQTLQEIRALDGELDLMDHAIADRLGMNRTDAQCMDLISRLGPMTAGELADRVGLTAGAITAVLDRLERGHWIRRVHDTVDRRRVMVSGGQAEHAKLQPIFAGLRESTREVLGRYSKEQLEVIADFLRRIAAIAAEHRQGLRRPRPNS
jgi:DNA-binding MarR family transcriptional regulator